jgi:hypothetical protein
MCNRYRTANDIERLRTVFAGTPDDWLKESDDAYNSVYPKSLFGQRAPLLSWRKKVKVRCPFPLAGQRTGLSCFPVPLVYNFRIPRTPPPILMSRDGDLPSKLRLSL